MAERKAKIFYLAFSVGPLFANYEIVLTLISAKTSLIWFRNENIPIYLVRFRPYKY